MRNNAAQKMNLPSTPVPNMSNLTKEQLKAEIEKGVIGAAAGRVTPAAEEFAQLRKEHQ